MRLPLQYIFFSLACILLLASCRCLTVPSCWLASGPTTKIRTNKYYAKHFVKTDSLLSTSYFYGVTDTMHATPNERYKYRVRRFLFYTNGLVLEQVFFADSMHLQKDTIHTYTEHLKSACCHAWIIGSYKVSNDTVFFASKSGGMDYWQYYKAKISADNLQVFEQVTGNEKNYSLQNFPIRKDKVVIRDIRLR